MIKLNNISSSSREIMEFYWDRYSLFNSLVVISDNSSVDNRFNNIEWKYLFKCQTESGTYSKSPFLLRNVNTDKIIGQPSRTNAEAI
ncbi:hypothetical protein BCR32DRAFT_287129 [Anaeromyces robustus]|uniref:Uncharacterized protein n=1 Tax=Anaeromyces robustus TaxID=1754192 RepID=A0A1Y1VTM6_9FUNG|nr:hypothetical protein BCR32DRAFT_287129 [Anaeromyces robustus]|eukprot:ORX64365.1 hypothetical protein BCR32DRAFT_287129 [Anaeromyces robustus]